MALKKNSVAVAALLVVVLAAPVLAGFFGTDLFLPSVGRKTGLGGTFWHTALWIHNPSGASVVVTVQYLPRGSSNPPPGMFATLTIPAYGTWNDMDALNTLFAVSGYGALRITSTARVLASCRMYDQPDGIPTNLTTGQDYSAIPATFAIGNSQSTQVLGAFSDLASPDPDFRTGFGYVEVAGGTANVRVSAIDPLGTTLGTWVEPSAVQPFENRYYSDFPVRFPGVSGTNLRLQFEVTGGTGKIIAVGSLVANTSNDGTTFEMAFADDLLGINTVAHDPTLIGDGTVGNPLGLNNGAVAKNKLAAAGGTSGQLLGTDGSALSWRDDGLKLPFGGSVSTAAGTDAFSMTNLGTGRVMSLWASADTALWANSTSGMGIDGRSTSNTAIKGISASGNGVWGTTNSTLASGNAGVMAYNAGTGPGLKATSVGGVAARFEKDSTVGTPQVLVHENNSTDYARVSFDIDGSSKFWTIAATSPTNDPDAWFNIYHSVYGNVFSLTGDGKAYVNGRLSTHVLEITGGADLAEPFAVMGNSRVEPGSLMVIDEANPGCLRLSTVAYDSKVAGIVSGAGDVKPGVTLQQQGVTAGNTVVAIAGRVYVKTEAFSAPVVPGDLLTTSDIPGYAMKATDRSRAPGAVIGKAMTGLAEGQGLVLVLVNLQ
jgi:hypothetical protein